MLVMVRIADAARADAHGNAPPELREVVQNEGLTLEAAHPGIESGPLGSWFTVVVDEPAVAERLTASARACRGVEAAYIEPPTGPPA